MTSGGKGQQIELSQKVSDQVAIDIPGTAPAVSPAVAPTALTTKNCCISCIGQLLTVNVFHFIFACAVTISVVTLCAYKIYTLPDGDPYANVYLTTLVSLTTLWIPVQFFTSASSALSNKLTA